MLGFKGLDLLLTTQIQFINVFNYLSMFNTWILKMPKTCFSCPKQLQNISCLFFENPHEFGAFYIFMCFDNFIEFYTSHHYYIAQVVWYQPICIF
jgi:hypothetical protein